MRTFVRWTGRPLNAFSLACLRLSAPQPSIDQWRANIDAVVAQYSHQRVVKQLARLEYLGFTTKGLPQNGYLTDKGRSALERVAR
jgi:hypothetical protein